MPKKIDMPSEEKAKLLLDAVEDRKAVEPHLMDLRGNTVMFDFMLVCAGTSDVHIRAIADSAMEKAEEARLPSPKTAGESVGEWILLDFGDVVVHVMSAEARTRYRLEQFWSTPQPKGALPPTPDTVSADGAAGEVYAGAQPNVFSIVPAESAEGEEDEDELEDGDLDAVDLDDEDWDDASFFEDADAEVEPIEEEKFDSDFEQEQGNAPSPRKG